MKYLIALVLGAGLVGQAGASKTTLEVIPIDKKEMQKIRRFQEEESERRDAEERQRRSAPYVVIGGTTAYYAEIKFEWKVSKGSETFSLSDFVRTGRLCAVIGHRWGHMNEDNGCFGQSCQICKKCRQKITVKEEVERWEP